MGIGGGLLALLTPCVFPIIPLTVSFFTKRGNSKGKALFDASFYGFCIVLVYFLFSLPFLIFKWPPDTLSELSSNIWVNLFFFVLFVIFAISFFGFFEIKLPSSWASKADKASEFGGFVGIFFMALTLAIVSFSCTGPILGSLLAGSLSTGDQYKLVVGMVGFGLGLGIPFSIFALFPQALPKSGTWLNTTKIILGFVELALAVKFLSNADFVGDWGLIKREVFLGIWVVISFLLGLYLLGVIRFPHESAYKKSFTLRMLAMMSFGFGIYLIYGIATRSNMYLLSGFPPPQYYSIKKQKNKCPQGLTCFLSYEQGLAYAKEQNKPMLIDFTGKSCVNCRKMEELVWTDPDIYRLLSERYVLVSLYTDDRTPLPKEERYVSKTTGKKIRNIGNRWSDFQATHFKDITLPLYALVGPDEKILNTPIGYTDKKKYRTFLQCGLDNLP